MSYMNLRLKTPVRLQIFTHDSSKQLFIAEASDIGDAQLFQRIYDDACDVGFMVCNPGTGQTILVTLFKETRDDEGEVINWLFTPSFDDVQRHPKLKNYRFLIYND